MYVSTLSYTTRTSHSRPIGSRFEDLSETTSDLQKAAQFDQREHQTPGLMILSGEHLIITQKKKNSGKDSEVLAQRSNEKTDFITRVNNVVLSLSTSEDGFNFLSISCQHMITNNGL